LSEQRAHMWPKSKCGHHASTFITPRLQTFDVRGRRSRGQICWCWSSFKLRDNALAALTLHDAYVDYPSCGSSSSSSHTRRQAAILRLRRPPLNPLMTSAIHHSHLAAQFHLSSLNFWSATECVSELVWSTSTFENSCVRLNVSRNNKQWRPPAFHYCRCCCCCRAAGRRK